MIIKRFNPININRFNFISMKRAHTEEGKAANNEDSDENPHHAGGGYTKKGRKKVNLPRKSKFRMRAHCNPLSSMTFPV